MLTEEGFLNNTIERTKSHPQNRLFCTIIDFPRHTWFSNCIWLSVYFITVLCRQQAAIVQYDNANVRNTEVYFLLCEHTPTSIKYHTQMKILFPE
jgi:hypothetical protein